MEPQGPARPRRGPLIAFTLAAIVAVAVAIVVLLRPDVIDDIRDGLADPETESDEIVPPDEGQPGEEPPPDVEDPADPIAINDVGPVGSHASALLRAEVPRLVLEVAVQDGVAADAAAIDHAVRVLQRDADKPGGIEVVETTFTDDRAAWSAAELRDVADSHRTHRSDTGTVTIVLLYVQGSFEQETALGVALNASVAALFPERWGGLLEGLLATERAVERAVLTHEVGHLLGLVELVYDSAHDREHPDAPGHSANEASVMHPAVRTTAVAQVFDGPPPDDFDDHDRDDLRFLRTGER